MCRAKIKEMLKEMDLDGNGTIGAVEMIRIVQRRIEVGGIKGSKRRPAT